MEKILISRQTLAKRWDFTDTKVIANYEFDGIITRVPNIPSPRYSLREIENIENLGQEINPLSPLERRRLENKIQKLEKELNFYKDKLNNIKILLNGL